MKKLIFVSMIILSRLVSADDGVRPSRLLLSAFSNQCPKVYNKNVSVTLVSLQSLYGAIEELKKDTNCGGAIAFSSAVSRYTSLYENFETQNTSDQDRLSLEKKIALYTSLLSDPNIASEQSSFIKTEIVTSQANLVNINSNLARFNSFSGKEAMVADQLVRAADDFLTELQTDKGNACYQKNSAKVSSLMSNALLVSSAFATGGTSLALAGGAVIVKSVGKYVGDLKYNNTLNNLQDIELPTALRCVSEVLTEQYCDNNETQHLISERIESINSQSNGYDGINLLSYQLSPLSNWLDEVFSGSNITSEGDLINREKSEIQSEFLRKTATYLETFGTIKRKFFLTVDNEANLKTAISSNIECLMYLLSYPSLNPCSQGSNSESSVENPIFTTYTRSLFAYELFEPGVHTTIPICGNDPCTSFSSYVNYYKIPVTINDWDRVIRNASRIIANAQNVVNIERSKMISVDAYSIIVNGKRELKGQISPLTGLKKIVANADRISNYLTTQGCKLATNEDCEGQNNPYVAEINNIQKTKNLTSQIIKLLNEGMIPRSIPTETLPLDCVKNKPLVQFVESDDILETKSFQITSCISKILKLQERGTVVYFNKIRDMVSYEMEARLLSGDLGAGAVNIVNSTKIDLVQSILNSYSTKDSSISLGELDISLESAQNNSKETLNVFFDFFKKNVIESLNSVKVSQLEKNDLCFRILPYIFSAKDSFIKDIYPACEKAQFNVYKNGPAIRFTDYVKLLPKTGLRTAKYSLTYSQDVSKYFCGYRQYNRANVLLDEQNKQKRRQQRLR